jgi:fructose-bisphosphate aldolase class I
MRAIALQMVSALQMVCDGKGILAADESTNTMSGRLEKVGVAGTEENRRAYREMLITTPNLSRWISGVILSGDIFHACLTDGRPFPVACADAGLMTGIKVDTGAKALAGARGLRARRSAIREVARCHPRRRCHAIAASPGG